MRRGVSILLLIISFSTFYLLLRRPVWDIYLPYYDDAETLYHVLSLLNGQVPYRDNYNHHFPGYLVPFLVGTPIFGFSSLLTQQVTTLLQVANGVACFALLRHLAFTPLFSYLAALLLISAREPWVIGFYPQFETNFLYLLTLLFTLNFIDSGSSKKLFLASMLAGVAFIADQRAILLSVIPLIGLLLRRESLCSRFILFAAGAILPSTLFISYLVLENGLQPFIEQTLIFPSQFRAGSKAAGDILSDTIAIYAHLPSKTPLHTLFAAVGALLWLIKKDRWDKRMAVVFISALPMLIMPALGGRDFDYYTIVVLPLLSIGAVLPTPFLSPLSKRAWAVLLAAPSFISLYEASMLSLPQPKDGVRVIVDELKDRGVKEGEVYMWGYRLDVYTELGILAHNPFASRIFVHPDHAITGAAREKHIYPKYEKEFFERMKKPPRFVVLFQREGYSAQGSRADSLIRDLLQRDYTLIKRVIYDDFLDKECVFDLYEKSQIH